MSFAVGTLSSIPVRKYPDLLSEMTNQLLFGECYEILDEAGFHQKIRGGHDHYTGWIDGRHGEPIDAAEFKARLSGETRTPVLEDLTAPAYLGEEPLLLVRGSSLPDAINNRKLRCNGKSCVPSKNSFSAERIHSLARDYLSSPYLWGGRSPFGIDCSGLVQTLYKFFDVPLDRDSVAQARQGKVVDHLTSTRPGDLAFFESVHDQSPHVGLVVEGGIIHASARVRFDILNEQGIFIRETGKHTHTMTDLRRLID